MTIQESHNRFETLSQQDKSLILKLVNFIISTFLFLTICCSTFLFFSTKLLAQTTFSKKTFTIDNGLPYNFVQHITQDSTGFLWISTWDGLSRYDGNDFRNYYHKPDDSTTFPFFAVDKVVVDRLNNAWVLCPSRPVVLYNRKIDNFEKFSTDSVPEFGICDLAVGTGNDMWLVSGEESKLYHFNQNSNSVQTFLLTDENGNRTINFLPQILVDNIGQIWFFGLAKDGYCMFKGNFSDGSKIQIHAFLTFQRQYFEPITETKTFSVYDIYTSETGKTWVFSTFGLFCSDSASNSFVESVLPDDLRQFSNKPYYFWSSEKSGIHIINTNNDKVYSIKQDLGKYVNCIFIDSQNTIWSGDILKRMKTLV